MARPPLPKSPHTPPMNAKSRIDHKVKSRRDELILAAAAGLDLTVTARTLARLPLLGKLPELGLKAQDTPAGRPKQLSVN
jgi:hypothetical protein